jgi:predicted dehydrogenase
MAEKILIVGLGSIGRRYARLLPDLGHKALYALRSGAQGPLCAGVKDLFSWDEVRAAAPSAAFITNPTSEHIATAIKCAELGMHLFIEKPLDMRLDRLPELKAIVKAKGLSAYVAYNLRFHPGVIELRDIVAREGLELAEARCSSYLPDWRPGTDHLKSYSASAALGGGVVLDLSHDPDYAGYIFGPVAGITGRASRSSAVTVDAEDTADLVLRLKGGADVAVHVDFCTPGPAVRTVKAVTRTASYDLDLVAGKLTAAKNGRAESKVYSVDRDLTYKAEVDYFFKHLGGEMMNGLDEAGDLLAKLLEFKRANGLK